MQSKTWGLVVFALGIFYMHVLMIVNFWLIVLGVLPEATLWGVLA